METLRQISDLDLFVSDRASAAIIGDDFSRVVSCIKDAPTAANCKTLVVCPSGKTAHIWEVGDLDQITTIVMMRLEVGGDVLIHCRSGVSRSTVAAAAVLLKMGHVDNVKEALKLASWEGRKPASQSVGSLKRWWAAQNQTSLF